MLTADEWQRYDRQILIKEIGEEGQEKLKRAKVLVAGAGGLGSPICLYLAAAGIGMIRIVDHDTVDLSNLNRQILHGTADIGRPKVDSAKDKLAILNAAVKIEAISGDYHRRQHQQPYQGLRSHCRRYGQLADTIYLK